jgi:glycosyltransferase involved in cell wall biosynthesis
MLSKSDCLIKLFIVVNVDWFFLSHRREVALRAKNEGYDVTIITKDTGHRRTIELLGLNFIDLPINRTSKNILSDLNVVGFLYKLYKMQKPDIIHHVGLKVILIGGIVAKLLNSNGVVNAISGLGILFSENRMNFVVRSLLTMTLRSCHLSRSVKVIFQNEDDQKIFVDNKIIGNGQSVLIKGSGIDLAEFKYTSEPQNGKIVIIITARMIVEKGIFIFLSAAQKLKHKFKGKVKFLICGGVDDNPKSISESRLMNMNDGEYIQWLGHRSDVKNLLRASHIVVLPSYYREGLPKSLIEAAASGRPIITTDSVGCKDAVIDGYNGFLIPAKDSDALAIKLEILIKDPVLRTSFGKNSRQLAKDTFSIEHVLDMHLQVYSELSCPV